MGKIDFGGLASQVLDSGEEFIAGIRVNWNGMVGPSRLTAAQGVAGLGMAEVVPPPDPEALVTFPSANQLALVLTGGRILCWSLGFSGKPKQYLGDVPLTAITSVTRTELRFGPLLRITMRSGAVVDLEVMRGDDGDGFFEQVVGLVEEPEQSGGWDPFATSAGIDSASGIAPDDGIAPDGGVDQSEGL